MSTLSLGHYRIVQFCTCVTLNRELGKIRTYKTKKSYMCRIPPSRNVNGLKNDLAGWMLIDRAEVINVRLKNVHFLRA